MDKKKTDKKKESVDIDRLEKLIDLFEKRDLSELEVEDSGFKVRLKKGIASSPDGTHVISSAEGSVSESRENKYGGGKESKELNKEDKNIHTVKSPMVGTFYRAPSPAGEPFVKRDDIVENGQVLCIIESMKIMNEIESDIRGRVVSILVESEHPVEYGEPLFLIEPLP